MHAVKRHVLLVLLAVAAPATAWATQPGWYVALDGGQAHYTGIAGNAERTIPTVPITIPDWIIVDNGGYSPQRIDADDTSYRLSTGYQFTPYFGVEVGYVSLGDAYASGNGTLVVAPIAAADILEFRQPASYEGTAKSRVRGWELAVIGSWPLSPRWSLFGRIGLFDSHTRNTISTASAPNGNLITASYTESGSKWKPTFGVGVAFSPVDHWALRLGFDRFTYLAAGRTNGINLLSLGVVFTL